MWNDKLAVLSSLNLDETKKYCTLFNDSNSRSISQSLIKGELNVSHPLFESLKRECLGFLNSLSDREADEHAVDPDFFFQADMDDISTCSSEEVMSGYSYYLFLLMRKYLYDEGLL